MGHNYIGHNYIPVSNLGTEHSAMQVRTCTYLCRTACVIMMTNYIGHRYIGHNYSGHTHKGHNYIGHTCMQS